MAIMCYQAWKTSELERDYQKLLASGRQSFSDLQIYFLLCAPTGVGRLNHPDGQSSAPTGVGRLNHPDGQSPVL